MTTSSDTPQKKPISRTPLFIGVIVIAVAGWFVFSPKSSPPEDAATTNHQSQAGKSDSLVQLKPAQTHQPNNKKLDPATDGWTSEVDAEHAKKYLSKLLKLAAKNAKIDAASLSGITDDFQCNALRPANLIEIFSDASIRVLEQNKEQAEITHEGATGLAEALSQFGKPLQGCDDSHTHVKVIRVTYETNTVTTTALIETGGHTAKGSVGQNSNWTCHWRRNNDSLALLSIHSNQFREVTASGPDGVWFADCTEAVLGKNPSFNNQLMFGLNHWLKRIERTKRISVSMRTGAAVGDVNGDGLDDLYICQPGGLPNRLFVQQADGTAVDRSAQAGLDWLDYTASALLVDLDNDGTQDLVAATTGGIVVMQNDKNGKFQWRATLPMSDADVQSLSAADYDNDGDLDIYICVDYPTHVTSRQEPTVGFVYHDANDGAANVLFRNDLVSQNSRWKFTNVTVETGLDVNNRRHSQAASWEDYDNDGDQDLYVANDYGQNCLYRNEGDRFTDVATESKVVDFGSGMSVSWADYNRDGWMDLYVGNMFSSAGNRITRQSKFRSSDDENTRALYSRFAKGNTLFTGSASGTFQEAAADIGVDMGRWAWSSLFADLNNDGWQDLLVANGYITTEDTGDL